MWRNVAQMYNSILFVGGEKVIEIHDCLNLTDQPYLASGICYFS